MKIDSLGILEKVSTINTNFFCESAWLDHGPFMNWLIKEIQPRCFVELGSQFGYSYFAGCQAVLENRLPTKCFAVDTWEGDSQAGFYGDKEFAEVDQYNNSKYKDFSKLLRMKFNDAVKFFDSKSIDLLHIDGFHTYDAVSEDFNTWKDKLSENAIVLFHDIHEYRDDFGVHKFWKEIKEEFDTFEFFHEHGLGVLKFGDKPSPIDFLFDKSNSIEDVDILRFIFKSAGASNSLKFKLDSKDEIIEMYYLDSMRNLAKAEAVAAELANNKLAMDRLLHSVSWRLTSPIRKLRKLLPF